LGPLDLDVDPPGRVTITPDLDADDSNRRHVVAT